VEVPGLHARGEGGRDLAVDGRLALIDLGDERVVEVSLRDLTLQKEIERQLQIAERLSSMGLLTAGVAHEINNPLEGIGNYLSLLQRDNLDEERRRRYLEQVRHGFERIRDIVADLLRFARPGAHGGQADLGQVVERSLAMAAYAKVFREVAVERRGLETPLPVTGDAGRLEQVVLNLLLNAATASGLSVWPLCTLPVRLPCTWPRVRQRSATSRHRTISAAGPKASSWSSG
jgi:signal transduction histidine kinase